ncbi:MAG: hypothetical protein RIT26_1529 [Pseudomonadota bacterium]
MPASIPPSPPPWLSQALESARPPEWLLHETQLKLVLLLNHVLQQAEHALPRTRRLSGRTVQVSWMGRSWAWAFTPAGLLEARQVTPKADLCLDLGDVSPITLAQQWWRDERPALRIEGDVQLAAEINWLVEHVRWDPEEDLARRVGDTQARFIAQIGRRMAQALQALVSHRPDRQTDSAGSRA